MKPIRKLTVICAVTALFMPVPMLRFMDTGMGRLSAQPVNIQERQNAAHDLISQFLLLSRTTEIYEDLRRTIRTVALPVLGDISGDDWPNGLATKDPLGREAVEKLRTFLEYALRASDEVDNSLAEHRDEIISDFADLLARDLTLSQINDAKELLRMPAMRKLFDTIYALSRLYTAFTYDELRSGAELSAWMEDLELEEPGDPSDGSSFSQEKMALAQIIVTDLLRTSRLDEMVADIRRFLEEVVVEVALSMEQDALINRDLIHQFAAVYEMQKAVIIASAPFMLASALSEEQLDKLQMMVRSPIMAKSFRLIHEVVRNATSFTAEDILGLQEFAEELEQRDGAGAVPGRKQKRSFDKEWNAFVEKWRKILFVSISPETREGLEQSLKDLRQLKKQIGNKELIPGPGTQL